jgi:hypothetical protein
MTIGDRVPDRSALLRCRCDRPSLHELRSPPADGAHRRHARWLLRGVRCRVASVAAAGRPWQLAGRFSARRREARGGAAAQCAAADAATIAADAMPARNATAARSSSVGSRCSRK